MADVVSPEVRSRMMAGIRSTNTRPEIAIRRALHAKGLRFRLHAANVPGKPDLVLPKYRAAVFVHGCFWHGHDCPLFRLPATRPEFWQAKIDRNRTRDAVVAASLRQTGWRQLLIWECAMRGRSRIGLEATADRATAWIRSDLPAGAIRGANTAAQPD